MTTTPLSLLARLRQPDDAEAWRRFVLLYTPLLVSCTRRLGLQDADAADLVQEVFTLLLDALPTFEQRPGKKFRAWLWTLTRNKYRERLRKQKARPAVLGLSLDECLAGDELNEIDEAEYRGHVTGRALRLMQAEFEPTTWKACWEFTVEGRSAAEVALALGITVNAVYLAKSRVLRRLREELDGLLD